MSEENRPHGERGSNAHIADNEQNPQSDRIEGNSGNGETGQPNGVGEADHDREEADERGERVGDPIR